MLKFIGKRTLQNLVVFFLFLTATFFLLQAQPGDISSQFLANPKITAEVREQFRQELGLTGSVWDQYVAYIGNFFQGDLGVSFSEYPKTVWSIMSERIPRTMMLFTLATVLSYVFGFAAGKILAWRRGRRGEQVINGIGLFLYTVFYPWFAIVMLTIFAFYLDWFPIGKFLTVDKWRVVPEGLTANSVFAKMLWTLFILLIVVAIVEVIGRKRRNEHGKSDWLFIGRAATVVGFVGWWYLVWNDAIEFAVDIGHHLVLPVVVLALVNFGGIMLLTRASMVETMREDFILTARAKGLTEKDVRDRHAARNALLPVTTSFVLALAGIIGGGVVTETVFSWPGMGQTLLTAAVQEDIPLTIGAFSFIAVLALFAHLLVDIMYMYLDPRIRV
jgi:peptide/nickel transport system permease protein